MATELASTENCAMAENKTSVNAYGNVHTVANITLVCEDKIGESEAS